MRLFGKNTAAETLLVLRQKAFFRLCSSSLTIRKTYEELDPELLTEFAHEMLNLATEAEHARKRRERQST